jgi:hypothetical protein
MVTLVGKDYLFYEDRIKIERLGRAPIEVFYNDLVLCQDRAVPRPLSAFSARIALKPKKDATLKIKKPIEIEKKA